MVKNLVTGLTQICRNTVLRCEKGFQNVRHLSIQPQSVLSEDLKEMTIDPLRHPDFFGVHKLFTVKDLFDAKVHYGHKEGTLDEKMKCFIYGSRLGHLIFDLDQTAELLRDALNFTAHMAYNDGVILFISKYPMNSYIIDKTAKECGEFSHTRDFRLGTFTNSLHEFGAVTRLPELCIFFNTLSRTMMEHTAVSHCSKMAIPSVGIVDTNCNPNLITYPVPGNDDSPAAIELYCKLFKQAILLGKEARKNILYKNNSKLYKKI